MSYKTWGCISSFCIGAIIGLSIVSVITGLSLISMIELLHNTGEFSPDKTMIAFGIIGVLAIVSAIAQYKQVRGMYTEFFRLNLDD